MAMRGDSPGEGEGKPGQASPDGKDKGRTGEKGKEAGNQDKDGKGKGEKDGKDGGNDKGKEKGSSPKGQEKGPEKNQDNRPQPKQNNDPQQAKNDPDKAQNKNNQQASSSSSSQRFPQMPTWVAQIAPILKWLVFAVIVVCVIVAVLRGGLGFLANFTDWAKRWLAAWKNFWANLFGSSQNQEGGEEEGVGEKVEIDRSIPFRAYSNPFTSGKAEKMSTRDLVRYTYAAVEAWARDAKMGRKDDETATEFLARLAEEVPALEDDAKRLGQLQARAEYGKDTMPKNTQEILAAVWQTLQKRG
jgi:hypothetical protein